MSTLRVSGLPYQGALITPNQSVSIIAPATPVVLHTVSQIGNNFATAKLVKIMIANRTIGAGKGVLQIGTGTTGAFTQRIPDIDIFPGLTTLLEEDELPDYWFNLFLALTAGQIIAQTLIAGAAAPNDVLVLPTFLEK